MARAPLLVTGGAGFLGACFVRGAVARGERVVTLDKLTYAGNRANLAALDGDPRHVFVEGDIGDRALVDRLLAEHRPRALVNLAAESHVDRSIDAPGGFVATNIVGTFTLLEAVRAYLGSTPGAALRFVQVSTDEVYGSLGARGVFDESSPYAPSSPYAASKASADHLVRAYHRTFGLDTVTSHGSNTYGPGQFPEKLIPRMIVSALASLPLPVYGDGQQVRDWLFVEDHAAAIRLALERGRAGATYGFGARSERANLVVVQQLCALLGELSPRADGVSYAAQIAFVADRPGHDRRYALDPSLAERELGWSPATPFAGGLRETVRWYLAHPGWWERAT